MLCGQEIGVELYDFHYMDYRFCEPPSTKSRELLMNWETGYRHEIFGLFEDRPQMYQAMVSTGLYANGERAEDFERVIFFDALDAEDDAWDELEEAIRSILAEDVGIEIQQSTGPLFCNATPLQNAMGPELSVDDYVRPPRPGFEISIEQTDLSSATIGGYVMTEAKDTGKRTTFGVTNAHVVLDSKFNQCVTALSVSI